MSMVVRTGRRALPRRWEGVLPCPRWMQIMCQREGPVGCACQPCGEPALTFRRAGTCTCASTAGVKEGEGFRRSLPTFAPRVEPLLLPRSWMSRMGGSVVTVLGCQARGSGTARLRDCPPVHSRTARPTPGLTRVRSRRYWCRSESVSQSRNVQRETHPWNSSRRGSGSACPSRSFH